MRWRWLPRAGSVDLAAAGALAIVEGVHALLQSARRSPLSILKAGARVTRTPITVYLCIAPWVLAYEGNLMNLRARVSNFRTKNQHPSSTADPLSNAGIA